MTNDPTVLNGSNGRGSAGRFGPGNKFARGYPHARRMSRLRAALLRTIQPADVEDVARELIELAKAGDTIAIKELLTRACGPATDLDLLARIERLETLATESEAKP